MADLSPPDTHVRQAAPRLWLPEADPAPDTVPTAETAPALHIVTTAPSSPKRTARPRKKPPVLAAAPTGSENPSSADAASPAPRPRYSPTIKDLPADERPRERLLSHGAQALSTAELIALLIRVGNHERSAVSLGEHLLAHFGNINCKVSCQVRGSVCTWQVVEGRE